MRVSVVVSLLALLAQDATAFVPSKQLTPRSTRHAQRLETKWKQPLSQSPSRFSAVQPLQASPLAILAATPAGALLVLAGIVLVHESGHYLAARSFGIKVEEFSIGFGPKLGGFEAFGNEFNLRGLPLGGYVRFPENYNTTLVREQQNEAYQVYKQQKKELKTSASDKILNAITFGLLEKQRRKHEEELVEEQKHLPWWKKLGTKKAEIVKSAPLEPEEVEIEYYDDPDLLQNRPWQQRAIVLSAGVIFNLILSASIYFGQIGFGEGLPQPIFEPGAVVTAQPQSDAPASGVLRQGDIIVACNDSPLSLSESPSAFESQKAINEFISKIRATPDGEALKLSVKHSNKASPVDVYVKPGHQSLGGGKLGPQSIGVLLTPNFIKSDVMRSDNLVEAASLATKYTAELTKQTADGLFSFFGEKMMGKGGPASQSVSGPIGLIKAGSEVVATENWSSILLFAAAISINLGVINAFPLPALDGGQLVFVLAEALTGRKLDQRVQESITSITVLLLLFASVGTAFGDIESIFSR